MGASASRIWTEICAIDSEHTRVRMVETVLSSPDMINEAKRAGVYGRVMIWLTDCRQGHVTLFPYRQVAATTVPDIIQHEQDRWSMYSTPIGSTQAQTHTQMVVSPAAKALDYFQESLALLGISEEEGITAERLKAGYRTASLRSHPDKGGSKEAFDEVNRAYKYVEKILLRINPKMSVEEKARLTTPVTMENALAGRKGLDDIAPVKLSSKKLDMGTFNKLFEENRLPDPARDSGYGDWLSSSSGSDEVAADPRLKGKFNQDVFEQVFRERALKQTAGASIVRKLEPDAIMPTLGTELGADNSNFTAAFGSDTQFVDLKEAYTTGSTRFHEVADVRVAAKSSRSMEETKRMREAEMTRVDPDEKARIAAAAAAFEERERQRRLRLAQQDTAAESWSEHMRRRLFVTNS